MSESRIGRLLLASLHQAIGDLLPDRLEFYENWLNARGLRRGTIGLAAISAVLSFLRGEGDIYADVVRRAGERAADWALLGVGRLRRALILSLPRPLRIRAALSLGRRIIRDSYPDTRAIVKLRRGVLRVELRGSLFCEVREPGERTLCGFYLALFERLLQRHNVPVAGSIQSCRGVGDRICVLSLQVAPARTEPAPSIATTAILLLLSLGSVNSAHAQAQPAGERLLVVPFENVERDPPLFWVTEAAAILLTDAVNEQGANAITRRERLRAFDELHLPTASVLSRATVIKVGQLVGAGRVVVGSIQRTKTGGESPVAAADELVVRVRAVRLDTGRLEPEITERAPLSQLFGLFQRVAARLLGRNAPTMWTEDVPLEAFESYVKGLLAESSDAQVRYLEAALKRHPRYDRVQLALWEVRSERGEYPQALAAARAVPESSAFARRARFAAALSLLDLKRHDDAFEQFKELNAEGPAAALHNDLGVVLIRRGWTAQTGKPAYYFDRAIALEPNVPDVYFNLGYAYALDNDPQAAIYWLREALRRNPPDADAHFVLGTLLQSTDKQVEAERELDLAAHLSATYAERLKRPSAEKGRVPLGLERVRRQLEPESSIESTIAMPAQRDQRELAEFHLDRGRRLVEQQRDREALTELRRAIYLSPYNAEAHLLLGRVYLRTRRVSDAIGALKISIWSQDSAPSRVALGEAYLESGDRAAAREQAERALALVPDSAEAKALLARTGTPQA
jgi:tetratricopeptide (TPR) repeat protein